MAARKVSGGGESSAGPRITSSAAAAHAAAAAQAAANLASMPVMVDPSKPRLVSTQTARVMSAAAEATENMRAAAQKPLPGGLIAGRRASTKEELDAELAKQMMDPSFSLQPPSPVQASPKASTSSLPSSITPVVGQCYECMQPVSGKHVNVKEKMFHVACFRCKTCKAEMAKVPFYEHGGAYYCDKDYPKVAAPRCGGCGEPVVGSVTKALGQSWHPQHFVCNECRQPFPKGVFVEKNEKPYCELCFAKKFAHPCAACKQPIVGEAIVAMKQNWHPDCFVCQKCRKPFPTGDYYEHAGLPYCQEHHQEQSGKLCPVCKKALLGKVVTAPDGQCFHTKCFTCTLCHKSLAGGQVALKNGKSYCSVCSIKVFN